MPRRRKEIDPEELAKLAAFSCTVEEVAAFFGTTVETVEFRLSRRPLKEIWERGRANGRISLRRAMFQAALKGNVTAQIWLSKNELGYVDKVEQQIQQQTSYVVELPPPMAPNDWAAAFGPRGPVTIEHEAPAVLPGPGDAGTGKG